MKTAWKKISIWTMVVVTLASTLSLSVWTRQAMALSVAETVAQMKTAAQLQIVANTFKKCVSMAIDRGDYPGGFPSRIVPNIFNHDTGGLGKNKEVTTGAWLEKQVQNKVNNGTIYCNDNDANLMNVFASTMGVSLAEVVCNGSSPGLLKARGNENQEIDCAKNVGGEGDISFVWNSKNSALYHLENLYNKRRRELQVPTASWGDVDTFTDDVTNYYLYLSEFQTACSSSSPYSGDPNTMRKSDYFAAIKMPDMSTGVLKDAYFSNKSITKKNWDSGWLGSSQPHTCDDVITRLNELAPSVQTALNGVVDTNVETAKHDCQFKATQVQTKLEAELEKVGDDAEAKKKIQERLDLVKKLRADSGTTEGYKSDGKAKDRTWITDSSGGIVCRFNPDDINEIDGSTTPIYNPADEDTTGTDTGLGSVSGGGTTEQENICAQAAGALTWIVCPVLQGLGKTVTDIYDMIEESFLRVDVSFMSTSGPTYQTWEKFQSLANIAFAIILLVVILSQITGFGISNYGIKKILPSLIMVAVLVNISFFLCQFAVDISNILGYEFRDRLLQFSSGITIDSAFGNGGAGAIVGSLIGGLFATVAVSGVVKILLLNFSAWIWPFLVSLLGVVIGILFFFIILGLRQVGIISLVVLSPLAIICYALPNTKSLFDRWRKMFTSLLVVYPICGLLMGGGQFVSKLLLKNVMDSGGPTAFMSSTLFGAVDNSISYFFYVIVALAIQVVPFFFIPNIVKSSMAAMGNIGAKISSFGSGLSKASTGAIRKSEGYKDKVERGKASVARGRIGRQNWREGLRKKGALGRVGAFVAGGAGESVHAVTRNGLTKAGEKLAGVKGLGWAGRGMTAMGKGMTAAHNQRQSRLQTLDMDQQVKDAKAGYAAGGDYQQRLQNRLDAEKEKHISSMAEDIEKANVGIANDEGALKTRHADALAALNANPESDEAQATMRAYQNMLNSNGDDGRRAMFDNFAQDVHDNGGAARAGTKMAADHLMRDHAKDIKPNSRDFFGALGKISSGKSHELNLQQFANTKGETHWTATDQVNDSVKSYDSAGFAKTDDATLERYIAQASPNGAGFTADESAQIERYTREALDGQHNIHVQGKVAGKMNQLRQALGYATITPGTVQVSGNSGGTGDSGPIQIHNNSAPMPEGFHEAPGSNIIIGGDVSGERIRQFQRQMDQHNNRNNNGNGPIIRP